MLARARLSETRSAESSCGFPVGDSSDGNSGESYEAATLVAINATAAVTSRNVRIVRALHPE